MPRLTSLLLFFFVLSTFYDIEGWEVCTVSVRVSRRNFFGLITYTTEWVLRNCTEGCCLSGCCISYNWESIAIFLVVVCSLVILGLVAAGIYYWKCRKPKQQYVVQGQNPVYPTQPVEQPGYNPYQSQIQPGSNPYAYSVPQYGAYPPNSPPYNPPMPQPQSQQQPGAYPPSAPPYNPPMPQPQSQQQSGAYPPTSPPQQLHQPGGNPKPTPPPPQ